MVAVVAVIVLLALALLALVLLVLVLLVLALVVVVVVVVVSRLGLWRDRCVGQVLSLVPHGSLFLWENCRLDRPHG